VHAIAQFFSASVLSHYVGRRPTLSEGLLLSRIRSEEAPQPCQVATVGRHRVVPFRSFENEGTVGQPRVAQERAEARRADAAGADVRMSVDTFAQRTAAVVDVHDSHIAQSDDLIQLAKRALDRSVVAEVVAGGEKVARVDADRRAGTQ